MVIRTSYTKTGSRIRLVLIGMVTNNTILSKISTVWKKGLFGSDYADIVGDWCIKHYRKFGKAPNENIQLAFNRMVERNHKSTEVIEAVGKFLQSISDEYRHGDEIDTDVILDLARDLFDETEINRRREEADKLIQIGEVEQAGQLLNSFRPIKFDAYTLLEPFIDDSLWIRKDEEEKQKPLVKYKDALAEFFEGAMLRGEFYSFVGPDKVGKTSCLIDLTYRAIKCRQNVLYIEAGDGDDSAFMNRLRLRAGESPYKKTTLQIPRGWNKDGTVDYVVEERGPLSDFEAMKKFRKACNNQNRLKVESYPSKTVTVREIDILIEHLANEGWIADVAVIDYADILAIAPEHRRLVKHEQVDETWMELRRLSQKHNILLVTATQSNSEAYKKSENSVLGLHNFSGSKGKNAHVNGMIGINRTEKEKAEHRSRWNWIARRRENHHKPKIVHLAGCYDIENPCLRSRW